jgi:pyruvate/2-oxoglutarate dehydrogenase complex dihydrolipoamide dehydrogenase (E3) component
MDLEIAKASQKFLTKQGLKFKLNTKVTAGEVHDAGVKVSVEAAKGGKEETVSFVLQSIGRELTATARRRRRPRCYRSPPVHQRTRS